MAGWLPGAAGWGGRQRDSKARPGLNKYYSMTNNILIIELQRIKLMNTNNEKRDFQQKRESDW